MSEKKEVQFDDIIYGRIDPKIYAFETKSVPPRYLKVGDTYRRVEIRLAEWQQIFNDLKKVGDWSAKIKDTDLYFRDYAVHQYLITHGHKSLKENEPNNPHSQEFFENTTKKDVEDAIEYINKEYKNGRCSYTLIDVNTKHSTEYVYPRGEIWEIRKPLQSGAIEKFEEAYQRKNSNLNLLMYAVMRFGKSFTSLCCAQKMKATVVLVVSAKADVKDEWKQNVERPGQFKNFVFLDSNSLQANSINAISNLLKNDKVVILFLTLQDLKDIKKPKFSELRNTDIDLMIIDETHFGARSDILGAVVQNSKYKEDTYFKKIEKEAEQEETLTIINKEDASKKIDKASQELKSVKVKLHLSGTPYRILMGSEFKEEDIISFCQYSNIIDEKDKWYNEHIKPNYLEERKYEEWENPYFGFPQMVRFAFNLNQSAYERLKQLENEGYKYRLSALFEPQSIEKDLEEKYKKFIYEKEIIDFLQVIGGSKKDANIFNFLDNEKIKNGQLCHHMIMVLPYCASCDAMEKLISDNVKILGKLKEYKILNVSGIDSPYKTINEVKNTIRESARKKPEQKTITLTVSRMMTGCTVPEWDTMIYLKDTVSPQEYDQAIFRLQSQYVANIEEKDSNGMSLRFKIDLKPQTLLIDFEPQRMFLLQAEKSKIYNVNTATKGNDKVEDRLKKELEISPIICLNGNKLVKVVPEDILKAVSNYSVNRSVTDEVNDISVDFGLFEDKIIRGVIDSEYEISSKGGINQKAYSGEDIDVDDLPSDTSTKDDNQEDIDVDEESTQCDEENVDSKSTQFEKKFKSYYRRILFYAFLTQSLDIRNLQKIIDSMDDKKNMCLAKNLGLSKRFLTYLRMHINGYVLSDLDNKIFNIYRLSHDYGEDRYVSPIERARTAVKNFGKLGESEIVTPLNIAKTMVGLIPDKEYKKIFKKGKGILDIASKMGEYAIAIVERAEQLHIKKDLYKQKIFSICTSPLAYEFTKYIYRALEINEDCIIDGNIKYRDPTSLNVYDLLEIKNDNSVDYKKIGEILTQNKPFNKISLIDKPTIGIGDNTMIKFDVVVGNPPYQVTVKEATEGNNKNAVDVFQHFQKIALEISDKTCLIYPAKDYQRGMLNTLDNQLVYLRIYNGSSRNGEKHIPYEDSVFGDVVRRIPGDVGIFLYDKNNPTKKIIYQNMVINRSSYVLPVMKEFLGIAKKMEPYINSFILSDIKKVCESNFVQYHSDNVLKQVVDRTKKAPEGYSKVLTNDKAGSGGVAKWYYIKTSSLDRCPVFKYKIIIPSAYPNESFNNPSTLELLDKDESFGRSRMAIYDSNEEVEIKNCLRYLKSKFARGISAMTPYKFLYYLPSFDYVKDKINWDVKDNEIEKQLFDLFKFDPSEVELITTMFK